jgi:hypothetical protein
MSLFMPVKYSNCSGLGSEISEYCQQSKHAAMSSRFL